MSGYTTVFGANTILPNKSEYSVFTYGVDTQLQWPNDIASNNNIVTMLIEMVPTTNSVALVMPDATQVSPGQTVVFSNMTAFTTLVKDKAGNTLVSILAGTIWTVYVTDNSTVAGTWRAYQNGSGTSVANAAALAGLGIRAIGLTLNQSMPVTQLNSNYGPGIGDRAKIFKWTGGAGVFTLPPASTVGNDWFIVIRNSGSGSLTLNRSGGDLVNGFTSIVVSTTESLILVCDGGGFFSIGYGRSAVSFFNLVPINVAGSGNYVLSPSEQDKLGYQLQGVITAARNLIVPNTVAQYWVDNQTTGAFTLTVKTAAGTGIIIPSANRYILYCDGTNVVQADTLAAVYPITVDKGGTGSITAPGALINLGGTSLGIAVFTAPDVSTAQAALGITSQKDILNYAIAFS